MVTETAGQDRIDLLCCQLNAIELQPDRHIAALAGRSAQAQSLDVCDADRCTAKGFYLQIRDLAADPLGDPVRAGYAETGILCRQCKPLTALLEAHGIAQGNNPVREIIGHGIGFKCVQLQHPASVNLGRPHDHILGGHRKPVGIAADTKIIAIDRKTGLDLGSLPSLDITDDFRPGIDPVGRIKAQYDQNGEKGYRETLGHDTSVMEA